MAANTTVPALSQQPATQLKNVLLRDAKARGMSDDQANAYVLEYFSQMCERLIESDHRVKSFFMNRLKNVLMRR